MLLVGWASGLKKTERWGAVVVICLERVADLHMAQLMPLPLTVSCFSKIQIGFTFLVPAHLGSPGQRAVKRVCVCLCVTNLAVWQPCELLYTCYIIIIRTQQTAGAPGRRRTRPGRAGVAAGVRAGAAAASSGARGRAAHRRVLRVAARRAGLAGGSAAGAAARARARRRRQRRSRAGDASNLHAHSHTTAAR